MRISLKRSLLVLVLLLLPFTSHAKYDPCVYFKDMLAKSPHPIRGKCIPLTAMLNWTVKETYTRHFGGFPSDVVEYKLCEAYPAALSVLYYYDSGKFSSFVLEGPVPQDKKLVSTDIISASAKLLGCYPGATGCKPYETTDLKDFRVKVDPASDGISFGHNDIEKPKGNIGASLIEVLEDNFMPKDKGSRSGLPEHLSGIVHGVHAEGMDAFTYNDAKKLMAKGSIKKMFLLKNTINYATKETYEIDGMLQLALAIGGAIDKGHSERISYDHPDPKCPYYSSKVCYDVKIDPCKSEVTVSVPIQLRSKLAIPMKHVETIEDKKGDIHIYMPAKPFTPTQVSQTDIEKVKQEAEVWIEGAWNHKKRLKAGGNDIQMNFEVQWVEALGNPCHVVDVLPGEGRSNTNEWYIGDGDLSYTAHEFGHYLGLNDEYKDRMCPKRPTAQDDNIMASGTTPKTRHYKPIAGWAGKATKTSYNISKY